METIFTNVKERVLELVKYKGISYEKFFSDIGVTYGNFKGEAKKKSLSSDTLAKIVTMFPDVDSNWLLTGEGEMIASVKTTSDKSSNYPIDNWIPLVLIEAVAGFGSSDFKIGEGDIQARYVVPDFNGIDFMIRIKGSSMSPNYDSGDVVACRIIKESNFIQWNRTYVLATIEQGIMVKRLHEGKDEKHLKAVSDNKEYPAFEIPKKEITGIALVVGVIRLE